MQTASAFSSVQDSLSFFISAYRTLAEWQSVVARLNSFEKSIRGGDALAQRQGHKSTSSPPAGDTTIDLRRISWSRSRTASRCSRLTASAFATMNEPLSPVPSGAGKSTLFRAVAGIWPFGGGRSRFRRTLMMTLPQRPYFPIGSLHEAVVYPAPGRCLQLRSGQRCSAPGRTAATGGAARGGSALEPDALAWRAAAAGDGARAVACAAILFLDEATASLDEPSEAALYRLIEEVAGDRGGLDRSSLDAERVSPAQCRAGPRRRSVHLEGRKVKAAASSARALRTP